MSRRDAKLFDAIEAHRRARADLRGVFDLASSLVIVMHPEPRAVLLPPDPALPPIRVADLAEREGEALVRMLQTQPATRAGTRALLRYIRAQGKGFRGRLSDLLAVLA